MSSLSALTLFSWVTGHATNL